MCDYLLMEEQEKKLFGFSHKTIAILLAILLIMSLGALIFVLFSSQEEKDDIPAISSPSPFPTPTPTPTPQKLLENIRETLGWNIYSNSQYGYSVKYPLDWNAVITPQTDPKILEYVVFNPLSATKAGELSITLTYTTRPYKEVLDSDPQPGETIIVSTISATRKLKEDSQRKVLISVSIPHNSNTLILLGKEGYKDIFNQMLSTLTLNP